MSKEKKEMTLMSECKFCGNWVPDPIGNSYWTQEPLEKHVTYTVCEACLLDERSFRLINHFVTEGIEYDGPYGEAHIQYLVQQMIDKHGPKSNYRYSYLEIDFSRAWTAQDAFSIRQNNANWYARGGNDKNE